MSAQGFITDDFLLETEQARRLYHDAAESLPIIDYHCHLPPAEIAGDQRWDNLTQVWLGGDHYKWRAMRTNGVAERYCTGDASDLEKFEKWAETVPYLLRNPLYHWAHLELARSFGVTDRVLSPETAREIWDICNARLSEPELSARGLMEQNRVVLVCTTDDPVDSLEHHRALASDAAMASQVLPTWRPDKGMAVEDPQIFNAWVDQLAAAADIDIGGYESYLAALDKRHAFFHDCGCRLSDHGIERLYNTDHTDGQVADCFEKVRAGKRLATDEICAFQSAMMLVFARMDHARGWTQQIHYGVMRNTNSRLFAEVGPDTGFDSIGQVNIVQDLARFLDRLNRDDQLPKTILYNANPVDNAALVTLVGSFQDGSVPGKVQQGSGWWFLDQKQGMEQQMETLSQMGLLSRFVGMITDSRSFLSYARHEYFRRILCNMLGKDMAGGLVPDDFDLVGRMVKDICYGNAARYFGFDLPQA